MKNSYLYIVLISGILPATYLFGITLLYLFLFLTDTDFSFSDTLILFCFIFGICGYIGLVMLLKGLHKTNQIRKSIFLVLGLLGFLFFFNYAVTKSFWDWIAQLEDPSEGIFLLWPLFVSFMFLIMMGFDFINKRRKNHR